MRRLTLPLLLGACSPEATPPRPADVVLTGGVVYTMEPGALAMEAVALSEGRIVAVGSSASIAAYIGPDTTVEALEGRAVLPGFVDAHTHPVWSGAELQTVDLYEVASMEELLAVVEAYATSHPDEPWVQGGGWDAPTFEGALDKALLDAIVPDRPVFLASADGHSAWVNSVALATAGITADTPDPPGGAILHDADGEPTGVLREDAVSLVADWIPAYSDALVDAGLAAALADIHAFGITTIIDANVEDWTLDAYGRAEAAGALNLRVYGAVEALPAGGRSQIADIVAMRDAYASPLIAISSVKFYLDGVIESETAAMIDPYEDGTNGELLFTDRALDSLFAEADEAGLQLHAHAIGDGAVRQMLDAVERLPPGERRPLAAHIEVIDPLDVPRFAALGVYADFQPLWAYPDAYITELTVPFIGADRAEWLYPLAAVAAEGGTLVAGSDWSVSSMNPWEAIEVAMTRRDPEDPAGEVLTPQHRVDLLTILKAYTADGARAVHAEADLGTLTPGKLADLVVLDRDPFATAEADLSEVRVITTFVGGVAVHRDDGTQRRRVRRPH